MKNLILFIITLFLISSCVTTHVGTISTSTICQNSKYVDVAYGVAQVNKLFGIGGFQQDALVLAAKRDLMKGRPLNANENYASFTVDFKKSHFLFYSRIKVTMSADIILLTEETNNKPYSDNYYSKIFEGITTNDLFIIGDTIIDINLEEGVIVSLEKNAFARILYISENNKIRTKRVPLNKVYSTAKEHNGYGAGDYYVHKSLDSGETEQPTVMQVVAVGINSLLIKNMGNNKISEVKYSR